MESTTDRGVHDSEKVYEIVENCRFFKDLKDFYTLKIP